MSASAIGTPDLLSAMRSRTAHAHLKSEIARANTEVTTGERQDLSKATGSDGARVAAIEHAIKRADERLVHIGMGAQRAEVMQNALADVASSVDDLGVDLLNSVETLHRHSRNLVVAEARASLDETLSTLNVSFGGRPLFAGAATGEPPFPGADELFEKLDAFLMADRDADASDSIEDGERFADFGELEAAIDRFFDVGNLVEDPADPAYEPNFGEIYSARGEAASVEVDDGDRLSYAPDVNDRRVIDVIKALATTVKAEQWTESFVADGADVEDLYRSTGEALLQGTADLAALRGEVGVAQERLEHAKVAREAERGALEKARAAIVARDPYDAATELLDLQNRLQALYTTTARLANLSFANYL